MYTQELTFIPLFHLTKGERYHHFPRPHSGRSTLYPIHCSHWG